MADTDEKKARGKSDKGKAEQQAPRPQSAEQMAKAGKDDDRKKVRVAKRSGVEIDG